MGDRPCQGSGLFNSYPVQYSKETHDLLKLMMNESKLTNLQQRNVSRSLKNGESLPKTSPKKLVNHKKINQSKTLNPRNYSGGVRSKETIEKLESSQTSFYRPTPVKCQNRQTEKDRLANLMAFGEDLNCPKKNSRTMTGGDSENVQPSKNLDRFDELVEEIEDRKRFLRQMTSLGKEKEYRPIIETEISKLILEMEIIDRKRTTDLERQIKSQKTK